MKGKKRFIPKQFIMFFVVIVTVIGFIVSNKIAYNNMPSQEEIISSYEDKKEKCELLKSIASESIKEGVGIDTNIIPSDEIQFHIYNEDGNIIFYYYPFKDSISPPRYYATITLTNEYKILKEDYSTEIESFDEYAKSYSNGNKVLSVLYGITIICCIYLVIVVLVSIVPVLRKVCLNAKKNSL